MRNFITSPWTYAQGSARQFDQRLMSAWSALAPVSCGQGELWTLVRNVGCEENLARWDGPYIFRSFSYSCSFIFILMFILMFIHFPHFHINVHGFSRPSDVSGEMLNSEALLGPDHRGGQELNGINRHLVSTGNWETVPDFLVNANRK